MIGVVGGKHRVAGTGAEPTSRRSPGSVRYIIHTACLCTALCLLPSPFASAAQAAPSIDRVELGFDGNYKLGYWTPLAVYVSGTSDAQNGSLEVIVPDSDGVPTRVRHPLSASAARLFVKIGRSTGEMLVIVRDGEREVTRRSFDLAGGELTPAMPSDSWLLLTLGTTKHLARTLAANKNFKNAGGRVASVTDAANLPDQWFGYEGVDAVVLPGSAADLPTLLAAAAPMRALDAWLRRGGTLLMTLGASGEKLLATPGPAVNWAPGRFDKIVGMKNAGALEPERGTSRSLETLTEERFSLNTTRLSGLQGDVKMTAGLRGGDLPLIVDRRYGFGRVLFVAFDLDEPLLGRWIGTGPLAIGLLLPPSTSRDAEASTTLGEVTHAGYDDLSGQLRSGLDQFQDQGVRLLPFGALLGLMAAYIALLGPGDYFLLKRFLKRMELTWITMPLLIVLSCGAAYALAVGLKGRDIHLNQVDLVDYDDIQHARRATSYFTVFSPHGQAYDLTLATPGAVDAAIDSNRADTGPLLSWFGLPGGALGGMESRAAPPLAGQPYDYAHRLSTLDEVPIPVWSTKSFVTRWTPQGDSPLTATLAPAPNALEGLLTGTVTNRSGTALEQCLLLTSQWAYRLGTLAAGERVLIQEGLGPTAVVSLLARRQETDSQYDPMAGDVGRIIEVMSFYQAIGGLEYTRLKNRYEAAIDISRQLGRDQAVLVGVRRTAVAEVRNGKEALTKSPEGLTVFRVIVPVQIK